MPLYIEHLRAPIDPARPNDRLPKGVVDMDRQLPEQTIVMFRQAGTQGLGAHAVWHPVWLRKSGLKLVMDMVEVVAA